MSTTYKNYLLRQMGVKESQIKPSIVERNAFPGIDPDELEIGTEDEKEDHEMSDEKAAETATQHLGQPDQRHYYTGMKKAQNQGMLKDALRGGGGMLSPTAIATPVIAVGIRGSSTGGLPSGADQTGISPSTPTGRLGGYEPIPTAKDNSELIDKTPVNPQINSASPKTEVPRTVVDPHPHQTQHNTGDVPQAVTGASTDSDSSLKSLLSKPKSVDIDVAQEEEEGKEMNDMDGEESMEDEDKVQQGLDTPENNGDTAGKCVECGKDLGDSGDSDTCPACKAKLRPDRLSQFMNEGKHKSGCQCGFCKNKGSFGKKKEEKTEKEVDEKKEVKEEKLPQVKEPDFAYCAGCGKKMPENHPSSKDKIKTCDKCRGHKDSVDETFKRHIVLMKEYLGLKEGRCEDYPCCGHEPGDCPGHDSKGREVWKCARCGRKLPQGSSSSLCSKCLNRIYQDVDDPTGQDFQEAKKKPEGLVMLSEAFEKMRGLANLGERRVMSDGLWNSPINEEKWIQKAAPEKTKGALHKDLGIPEDKTIPIEKLESLKQMLHTKSEKGPLTPKELKLSRRVNAALNMRQANETLNETFKRHKKLMNESFQ